MPAATGGVALYPRPRRSANITFVFFLPPPPHDRRPGGFFANFSPVNQPFPAGFSLLGGDLLGCTAVTPPTAAGPSSSCSAASTAPTEATTPAPWSSSSSSSPPSASSGSAPSRWSSTVRSLFTTPPATEAKTAAAPPPQASQSAGRGRDDPSSSNREEDANRAVASMMAALSLDDDGDEEEDDELVGLSMKPATWGALPSFLLAEEGEEEDGSLLPRASQLSNRLASRFKSDPTLSSAAGQAPEIDASSRGLTAACQEQAVLGQDYLIPLTTCWILVIFTLPASLLIKLQLSDRLSHSPYAVPRP